MTMVREEIKRDARIAAFVIVLLLLVLSVYQDEKVRSRSGCHSTYVDDDGDIRCSVTWEDLRAACLGNVEEVVVRGNSYECKEVAP